MIKKIVRDVPQSFAALKTGNSTREDLTNSREVDASSGVDTYAIFYRLEDHSTHIYIGSRGDMRVRKVEHQTATRSSKTNSRNHYKIAKETVSRKTIIMTRMLDEGVEQRGAENLFFLLFGSYLKHVANPPTDTMRSLGRWTFVGMTVHILFDISKDTL